MAVQANSVKGRRSLHFNNLDEILADVERLDRSPVRALGNWSPGQVLRHLVITMAGSLDGLPFRAPLWVRMVVRPFKGRMLTKPMSAGFKLPAKAAQHLGPPPTEWAEGVRMFREVMRRLQTESKREPSPLLGTMTREQWDQLHCRHAELHLSFLVPG